MCEFFSYGTKRQIYYFLLIDQDFATYRFIRPASVLISAELNCTKNVSKAKSLIKRV
jgi:hypothetical protein